MMACSARVRTIRLTQRSPVLTVNHQHLLRRRTIAPIITVYTTSRSSSSESHRRQDSSESVVCAASFAAASAAAAAFTAVAWIIDDSNSYNKDNNNNNNNDEDAEVWATKTPSSITNLRALQFGRTRQKSFLLNSQQSDSTSARHSRITLASGTHLSSGVFGIFASIKSLLPPQTIKTTHCYYDEKYGGFENKDEEEDGDSSGYTETERFLQMLQYHRDLLFDYTNRWGMQSPTDEQYDPDSDSAVSPKIPPITWPRNIPSREQVPALELDLQFCKMSPKSRDNKRNCQNLAFRIASYYLAQTENPIAQRKGFYIVKDLAENGHPDAMCMYAMILYEGRVPGAPHEPKEALTWWKRCVDAHRHITAMYELGIALYTSEGEGVRENPEYSVRLFRQAAHLGHAGAAYMLGECLLEGVGIQRDRAMALEWLVTAAELGHHLARRRVFVILKSIEDDDENREAIHKERVEEARRWVHKLQRSDEEEVARLERRHTKGGSSLPQAVVVRRISKVQESRDEESSQYRQQQEQ